MTEKNLTNRIMAWLKQRGFVMKVHGSAMQMAGMPDILFVRRGRVYFFEVKRPGKVATPLQAARIEELRLHGAHAYVVNNLDDVQVAVLGNSTQRQPE